jgi:hypothetical protein
LLTTAVSRGRQITPAGEWLLDNFSLAEEQIRTARRHLPEGYIRELPRLPRPGIRGCTTSRWRSLPTATAMWTCISMAMCTACGKTAGNTHTAPSGRFEDHALDQYGVRDGNVMCEGGEPSCCAIWREKQRAKAAVMQTMKIEMRRLPAQCARELRAQKMALAYAHVYDHHVGGDESAALRFGPGTASSLERSP